MYQEISSLYLIVSINSKATSTKSEIRWPNGLHL